VHQTLHGLNPQRMHRGHPSILAKRPPQSGQATSKSGGTLIDLQHSAVEETCCPRKEVTGLVALPGSFPIIK
jgi:hypothetical protein